MNFDPPAPPDRAAVLSHTDGLDMKVSTRQKQGATRHKGVGAKGDNSAFPPANLALPSMPYGPSAPRVLSVPLPVPTVVRQAKDLGFADRRLGLGLLACGVSAPGERAT